MLKLYLIFDPVRRQQNNKTYTPHPSVPRTTQPYMGSLLVPAALALACTIVCVPYYHVLVASEVAKWVKFACLLVEIPIVTVSQVRPSYVSWINHGQVLIVFLYRSTFHPLAKYPGPWWAGLTDLYTAYHLSKGDRHIDFHRLHEKHGKRAPNVSETAFSQLTLAKERLCVLVRDASQLNRPMLCETYTAPMPMSKGPRCTHPPLTSSVERLRRILHQT
jgi:hypothetical protein